MGSFIYFFLFFIFLLIVVVCLMKFCYFTLPHEYIISLVVIYLFIYFFFVESAT